jgi:GNAT superfamily N-acetyltransferase
MATPSTSEIRDLYDHQVRRNATPDASGSTVEATPECVRWNANDGLGWSEISWSKLDDENASEIIEKQLDFFRERQQSFVWRVHDYDEPSDLGARLESKGFSFAGRSAVMVVDAATLSTSVLLPLGTELRQVSDEAGVGLLIQTHEDVFGHNHDDLRRSLLARLERAPWETEMFVVTADGAPVSSGRIEFLPEREFATLWGGGTLPEWRGRGIYKALVAQRAHVALTRGYKFLWVLASDESRPILRRLGFDVIANVATYSWDPSRDVHSA